MEKLAEYLAKEIVTYIKCRNNIPKDYWIKDAIQKALANINKQDLLKMLDVKQYQCKETKRT